MIDLHSHILPGVDDGCRTMNESIRLLTQAAEEGITAVVCTPHYNKRMGFVKSSQANNSVLLELQERLVQEGIAVKLYLGSEVYTDIKINDLLKDQTIVPIHQSRYVLVEFDVSKDSPDIDEMLYNLVINKYLPLIAHVERYEYLMDQGPRLEEWINMGCRLQVNASSIEKPLKFVKALLKAQMVHVVASDAHHQMRPLHLSGAYQRLKQQYSPELAQQLLIDNPQRVLDNQVIPDNHQPMKRGWFD